MCDKGTFMYFCGIVRDLVDMSEFMSLRLNWR